MPFELISVRITVEEKQRVEALKSKGVSQPEIFRRGMEEIEKDVNLLDKDKHNV